jgi:hypothetical protein
MSTMSKDGKDDKDDRDLAPVDSTSKSAYGEVVLAQKAIDARTTEHSLTLRDAFRYYRPAIGWSFLFSLGVIMAGFDPQLVGTLIAIPRFQHDFGVQLPDRSFVV